MQIYFFIIHNQYNTKKKYFKCFKTDKVHSIYKKRVFIQYYVFHILPQILTTNHATFPIQMYAIIV